MTRPAGRELAATSARWSCLSPPVIPVVTRHRPGQTKRRIHRHIRASISTPSCPPAMKPGISCRFAAARTNVNTARPRSRPYPDQTAHAPNLPRKRPKARARHLRVEPRSVRGVPTSPAVVLHGPRVLLRRCGFLTATTADPSTWQSIVRSAPSTAAVTWQRPAIRPLTTRATFGHGPPVRAICTSANSRATPLRFVALAPRDRRDRRSRESWRARRIT